MGTEKASRTGLSAIMFLAVALMWLPAGTTSAACSAGNRVDHRDAECLNAWWKNRGLFRKSPYHVRNMCPGYGTVVAKVDLKSASDRTLHLADGHPRDGDTDHQIRGISCCSDTGALCNRSDVVTNAGCLERFRRTSSAEWTCMNKTAAASISGENYNCTIWAQCKTTEMLFNRPVYSDTSITVAWLDLDDVHNCNGTLTHGSCSRSRTVAPSLSVGDARAGEGAGAFLEFTVTLSRSHPEPVTVRYVTSDRTATAGSDYVSTAGTLAFAANETSRTVRVRVLDDDHDEGPETLVLTLSAPAPSQVRLADAEATGTISNTDRIPGAWLARFGRTVTDHALEAVNARMWARSPSAAETRRAGPRSGTEPGRDTVPGSFQVSGRAQRSSGDAPMPSSPIRLMAETNSGGFLSIWGRGAATGFSGQDGDLQVDGTVTSSMFGADWARGSWATGLMVSYGQGDGRHRGVRAGTVTSTLTAVWPWFHHSPGERLSVWGIAGYGTGGLVLEPEGAPAMRTDMHLAMTAAGLRGLLVDGGDDGLTLAANSDAAIVRVSSDAVSGIGGTLAAATANVIGLRLGLEGSRPFRLANGSVITPGVEVGLRRDGGDAETGVGVVAGAAIAWRDARRGLGVEFSGHGSVAHEEENFSERGFSASFTWDRLKDDRGPRLSLTRTLGVATQGGTEVLPARATLDGLLADDNREQLQQRWLELRFGYGFAVGDRFTSTPEIAIAASGTDRSYSLGWRLVRRTRRGDTGLFELSFEARRHESAGTAPESGVGSRPGYEVGLRLTERY